MYMSKVQIENVIPIMYGYPVREVFEKAEKGNLKLGGCMIYDIDGGGMADRYYKDCENEWCVDYFLMDICMKMKKAFKKYL